MSDVKLDQDELALLDDYEAGELQSAMTPQRKQQMAELAENTFKKDKRINIRISSRDLAAIQRRALEEGLPYQSLVSSILHKYVSGGLRDVVSEKANNQS